MLTVMFASHNGERTLPAVLEAYRSLEAPEGGWQLVVADNASTDRTAELLDVFSRHLPLTSIYVAERGKNRALNAALAVRAGDLLVFSDDDAVPDPHWLVEMRAAADRNPGFDIFGGAIKPRWERPPEPWHLDWVPLGVTYAITDPKLGTGPLASGSVAWGPNMALRARLFDEGYLFDENIGPRGGVSYRMGSETELTKRLEQRGCRAWFVGTAVVEHIIRTFQMEKAWVLDRAIRYGRGLCYRERIRQSPGLATVFGLPRYRVRRLAEHACRLAAAKLSGRQKDAFDEAWAMRCEWGYLSEVRKLRMSEPTES
jgi:L-malate glycosyltransferase